MSSRSDGLRIRRGIGRALRLRVFDAVFRRLFSLIVWLLSQCNHLLVSSELHLQRVALRRDGYVAIAQAADEIKRLARRLLSRQTHLVVRHALLDRRAHVRSRAEESVRRYEPVERLVRALEVVRVDEMHDAPVAVSEIRKHRARQKLVPERLPKALDLAERLRMLRSALHVPDAVLAELLFEFSLAAPSGVLPALVRQDFLRRAVLRYPARQRLHHQVRLLMMCQRKRHDVPRVVVHEAREVEPLVLAQEKREDVALPKLIGLRALEAPRRMLARTIRRRGLDQTGFVQNRAHLRLAHAERLEAREHITNAAGAVLRMLLSRPHHRCALCLRLLRYDSRRGSRWPRHQRIESALLVELDPCADGRERNSEEARHREPRRSALHHLLNHP
jgi:hypothetical protein